MHGYRSTGISSLLNKAFPTSCVVFLISYLEIISLLPVEKANFSERSHTLSYVKSIKLTVNKSSSFFIWLFSMHFYVLGSVLSTLNALPY